MKKVLLIKIYFIEYLSIIFKLPQYSLILADKLYFTKLVKRLSLYP